MNAKTIGLVVLAVVLGGCGGGSSTMNPPSPGGSAPVSLTITDTPPAGVTILSFEITVSGATLSPGNVQLVGAPVKIEVKQLETESAFLSTVNVPAGTYDSITLSLSNPELTVLNQSGGAIGSCASGAVCELEPSAAGMVTFSGSPFPVTIEANAPKGFRADVNLDAIINSSLGLDFTAPGAVTVAQLPLPGEPAGHFDELDDISGIVKSIDAGGKKFSLETLVGTITVTTDTATDFEFEDACSSDDFACLAVGQVVEVDLRLMSGGAFLAKEVSLEDADEVAEVTGVVSSVVDPTHFRFVVLGALGSVSPVTLGNPLSVTLDPNISFRVDARGLLSAVPSGAQQAFESSTDTSELLPGQTVQLRVRNITVGTGVPIAVTTDRIRLRFSQTTGTITGAPVSPNFVLGSLSALFTNGGVSAIQVQTSSKTSFTGGNTFASLADGTTVSVSGLLFRGPGSPQAILVAKKVRKR